MSYEHEAKAMERDTLAQRVERLEYAAKDFDARLQKILEDLESHHIRVGRVERETGLMS